MDTRQAELIKDSALKQKFLLCMIGEEVFAVELNPVREIIRVPDPVPVPLAPDHIPGIINLRGSVLPLVSMRSVLRFPGKDNDESTRAIITETGQTAGLVVDRVLNVIEINTDRIEPVEKNPNDIDNFYIKGIIRNIGRHPLILIPDIPLILGEAFRNIKNKRVEHNFKEHVPEEKNSTNNILHEISQFVSFKVDNQEYAVPLDVVLEIVEITQKAVQVPNVHECILGIIPMRDRFIPLVDIRILFGFRPAGDYSSTKVIILETEKTAAGIIVDSVSEVLTVDTNTIESLPEILSGKNEFSDVTNVCRLDNGKRIIPVLSAEKLTEHTVIKEVLESVEEMKKEKVSTGSLNADSFEQFIVFILNGNEFGVPITSVQEIVRIPETMTSVPKAPDFIEGVMNLRGTVLPVIDQRKRMGLPASNRNDRQRIMVFIIDGVKTGFIVDAVTEVLKIPESFLEKAPALSDEQSRLLDRVANLNDEKRIIQIVNPDYLLEREAVSMLKEMEEDSEGTYS